YYDQIAVGSPSECTDPNHGHGTLNSWNRDSIGLIKELSERCRNAGDGIALAIEGAADIYIPYALIQSSIPLFHTGGTRFYYPELYKYTFPEAIIATLAYAPPSEADTAAEAAGVLSLPREDAAFLLCRALMT